MNFKIKIKHFFSPISVLFVTAIFFLIPGFFENSVNNDYHHDPLLWILSAYWTIALFLYPFDSSKMKSQKIKN